MVTIARVVVAGTHSGCGKTTVATGLMAALRAGGLRVAGFKVGPDFIDPSYHSVACGRPGRNLDAFLSGPELVGPLFAHGAGGCDVAVVEGVMGLHDGRAGAGEEASTAQVAKLLPAPVLLIVDARSMARSAAAVVLGFRSFDPEVNVAGVVLNGVGSHRHESMLREAVEPLGVPVVGVLRRLPELELSSRHLGLVPAVEEPSRIRRVVDGLGTVVGAALDLERVLAIARGAPAAAAAPWSPAPGGDGRGDGASGTNGGKPDGGAGRTGRAHGAGGAERAHGVGGAERAPGAGGAERAHGAGGAGRACIAVAGGRAFSFVYRENLEMLSARGACLAFFDPTVDEALPAGTRAVYLGGGFPEVHAAALSANEPMRASVRAFVAAGGAVVAECGGLLYLCRSLDGAPMCGVLEADASMTERLTLGYRTATAAGSWLFEAGTPVRAHEFHYASVTPAAGCAPAWLLGERAEGFVHSGLHASFLHGHWAATPGVPDRLVARAIRRAA
jgi:cobyrinic acid a,c-diamide synthase